MIGPVSFADQELKPYEMPGSSPPVGMRRLLSEPDGSFYAAVRFPAGFRRPGAGRYPVPEEFAVVEGALVVSGRTYRGGDYAFLPANYLRVDTHSDAGALAVAWFGGPPAWSAIENRAGEEPTGAEAVSWSDLEPRDSPLGSGVLLGSHNGAQVWLLGSLEPTMAAPTPTVLVSLPRRELVALDAGEAIPPTASPVLARLTAAI